LCLKTFLQRKTGFCKITLTPQSPRLVLKCSSVSVIFTQKMWKKSF